MPKIKVVKLIGIDERGKCVDYSRKEEVLPTRCMESLLANTT